jgi:hypothetical protein
MGRYTGAVYKQRFGKYFHVTRHQILHNATVVLQQWKQGVPTWFVPSSYLEENWGHPVSPIRESVKGGLELEAEE